MTSLKDSPTKASVGKPEGGGFRPLLMVHEVSVSSPRGEQLLHQVSFALHEQSKVGLVGPNGTGKSTLLKLLGGVSDAALDEGTITKGRRDLRIEYVPQFPPPEIVKSTLLDAVIHHLRTRLGAAEEEWKAYVQLSMLGFSEAFFSTPVGELSGGECNRALLARALVAEPDLLLLDEPTNHLDTEGILQFEELLQELQTPYVLTSHDRKLLDTCTTRTLFLDNGAVHSFDLPYTQAREALRAHKESLAHLRREQEKRLEQIEKSVKQLQVWAHLSDNMAPVYRAALTKRDRFASSMIEVTKEKRRNISLEATEFTGEYALMVHEWEVTIPGTQRILYRIPDMVLEPGDRAVILGINGAGKTTFLESIVAIEQVKEYAPRGKPGIRFNPQVELGYYDQQQERIDLESTLYEQVSRSTSLGRQEIHASLVNAGFSYERHHDKVKTLSGGERARLLLLTLQKEGINFLVLDEPTNYIDVEGIERLEGELSRFEGTVVMVSHDRQFVEKVANRFFLIKEGFLIEVPGIEAYFLHLKEFFQTGS